MEFGFILVTDRHPGGDCRTYFCSEPDPKDGRGLCGRNGFHGRRQKHGWLNTWFGRLAIPGLVRSDGKSTKRQGFLPAIGLHGLKVSQAAAPAP
jgi:hypothetical protein